MLQRCRKALNHPSQLDKILFAIQRLPNIAFTREDAAEASHILSQLDTLAPNKLPVLLATSKLNPNLHALFVEFCVHWESLATHLIDFYLQAISMYAEQKKSACGADELLPFIIENLPNNAELLQKVAARTNELLEIIFLGEAAYYLTNLNSAIKVKLSCLPVVHTAYQELNDELFWHYEIQHFLFMLRAYKEELIEGFFDAFQLVDKVIHQYYIAKINEKVSKEAILEMIINTNINHHLTYKNKKLNLYLAKYDAVVDLEATLSQTKITREAQLIKFAKKYENHRPLLQQDFDDKNGAAFENMLKAKFSFFYELVHNVSQEEKFISLAELVYQEMLALETDLYKPYGMGN